jgi:hypothetical protein
MHLKFWILLSSLPSYRFGRRAFVALLTTSTLLQGYSLDYATITLATEESRSESNEENDDSSESTARTVFAASQSCHKRLLQQHGKSSKFVRPLTRAAYSEKSSHSLLHLTIGAGIHTIPMRC